MCEVVRVMHETNVIDHFNKINQLRVHVFKLDHS